MSITAEKKAELIKTHQVEANDTGSPQVQVAILTERITNMSAHMNEHKKDLHSRRGLLAMVAKRRKLLDYLKSKNKTAYQDLIKLLGIRR